MANRYFSGQGKLRIALITAGVVGALREVGNVSALSIETSVDEVEHKESQSGFRAVDHVLVTGQTMTIGFTTDNLNADNLALAFKGAVQTVKGATVTDETKTLAKGDTWQLQGGKITDLVITDNASQPLVAGTDYLLDANFGRVTYISTSSSLTQPLKASYKFGDKTRIEFLSQPQGEYYLVFDGLNTAESNAPVKIEIYKAKINLDGSFDVINDEYGELQFTGQVLMTDGKMANIELL